MHEIDLDNLPRRKTYDWFNSFNNPTYGLTVKLNVTSLVEHTKKHNESFFINMLYIVVKALNSVDNLRMRFENNKPVFIWWDKSRYYSNDKKWDIWKC